MSYNKDFVWVFNDGRDKFKQLSKPIARKSFRSGEKIYVLPCKVNPMCLDPKHVGFVSPCVIEFKEDEGDNQFDRLINMFECHNCNAELGYYAHYYIRVKGGTIL